jgi:ATP-dependent Clp protease adaptor protein ClpS
MSDKQYEVMDKPKAKKSPPPKKFKVVIFNDDYTPMDFVLQVIAHVFHKTSEQATTIMLEAHKKGKAIIGIYPHEIAETKSVKANEMGKVSGFPLKTEIESE